MTKAKIIETRTRHGLKYRRYEQAGERYTTVEIPLSVAKSIGIKRLQEAHATWQRGQEKRERSEHLRNAIIERLPGKPTAIAHELGCSEAYVRLVRQQVKIPIAQNPRPKAAVNQ
jgi:hypothetical protein